jgi:hypothetical protein
MARTFNKFELPEEEPQGELILPEVEEKEEDDEPKGMTLREGHAFKATDLFEVSKKKEVDNDDDEGSMKSLISMFKTLRMLMKMMKGLDGDK